ncbi:MAG: outer membrane beta-barrel protein [Pseudorhodoplanes sp.]
MAKKLLCIFAVACLGSAAIVTGASAQTSDESMKRLEAKLDALAKENASLRSRLTKVEAAPRAAKPKQEPGYVGPIAKPSADPTPQQIAAARESFAADMPVAVKYAPPPRPACAQFGGWYVGGNVGANYVNNDWKDRDNFGFRFTGQDHVGDGSNSRAGWNAGGQLGWDYQSGCTIWGVVADINWASTDINVDYRDSTVGAPGTLGYGSEMKWFGTARTRAGVVVDNLLLYVTGGFAFAKFDRNLTYQAPGGGALALFSDDSTRIGFVVGVGTSWNLGNNWSLGSEILYMGFQKDQVEFACTTCGAGGIAQPNRYEFNDSVWVTRVNLNYRFGDYGKSPVMAKY